MDTTDATSKTLPLRTPYGTFHVELRSKDKAVITSGRQQRAGNSLVGLAPDIVVDGRSYQVHLELTRRDGGAFEVGVEGQPLQHSRYGDYWIRSKDGGSLPFVAKRRWRHDSERIRGAAVAAFNDWRVEHPDEFAQAVSVAERTQLREELDRLNRHEQRLERESMTIEDERQRLKTALSALDEAETSQPAPVRPSADGPGL